MPTKIDRISPDLRSEVMKGQTWMFGLVAGVFGTFPGCAAGGLVGAPTIGVGFGYLCTVLLVIGGVGYIYANTTYDFYDDRVVVDSPVGTEQVFYENVAVALRTSDAADARHDTADFELIREGEDNLDMPNATEPDRVEHILQEHLPSATEWLDERDDRDTALRAVVRRRRDREQEIRNDVLIVDGELLGEWMDLDVDAMDNFDLLDELDDIDDVDDVSDLDVSDFKAAGGDIGGDDFGGGDFDGGGGDE